MTGTFNVNIPCQQRPFFLVFGGLSYFSDLFGGRERRRPEIRLRLAGYRRAGSLEKRGLWQQGNVNN